ncbi:hypothetical protein [Pseudomonas sp. NFACC02]|uniref:hypothetical protein n=1 Tax=Pseudomonas sp. NFACC02 TaxID=1566250 RepID=UPI000B8849E4|nr:hypothetical protein [Pseudomonas sp. NFACC02]
MCPAATLLISIINKKFMRIPTTDLDGLILSVLHVILKSRNKEKIDDALLSLKSAIDLKSAPRTVVSRFSKFIVWISGNGNIGCHYRNLSGVSESASEYTKIKALAKAMLPPE